VRVRLSSWVWFLELVRGCPPCRGYVRAPFVRALFPAGASCHRRPPFAPSLVAYLLFGALLASPTFSSVCARLLWGFLPGLVVSRVQKDENPSGMEFWVIFGVEITSSISSRLLGAGRRTSSGATELVPWLPASSFGYRELRLLGEGRYRLCWFAHWSRAGARGFVFSHLLVLSTGVATGCLSVPFFSGVSWSLPGNGFASFRTSACAFPAYFACGDALVRPNRVHGLRRRFGVRILICWLVSYPPPLLPALALFWGLASSFFFRHLHCWLSVPTCRCCLGCRRHYGGSGCTNLGPSHLVDASSPEAFSPLLILRCVGVPTCLDPRGAGSPGVCGWPHRKLDGHGDLRGSIFLPLRWSSSFCRGVGRLRHSCAYPSLACCHGSSIVRCLAPPL